MACARLRAGRPPYPRAVSRRALTTVLALALAVGLALAALFVRVPYVVLSPGPAFDTLGQVAGQDVLKVTGGKTYPTDGALDATTVSVTDGVSLLEAMAAWLSRGDAVIPREVVYPPTQTQQQTQQQNTRDMRDSQRNAVVAALDYLGRTQVVVLDVTAGGPSVGRLVRGDVLTTVDGTRVAGAAGLRALVGKHAPGESAAIGYRRQGKAGSAVVRTTKAADSGRPVLGIQVEARPDPSVKVEISLGEVGGPSAGLVFALGLVDKLEPGSLTGGKRIAGTGEITADGQVGAIGGIAQKMRGARKAGATVFLVPSDNCVEARQTAPDGLRLVRAETLRQTLASLAVLRDGGSPAGC